MNVSPARTVVAAAVALGASAFGVGTAAAESLCRIDGGAVYFSQNEANLNDESKAALTRIAAEARACEAAAVLVRTGAGELADERAQVIADEFAAKGVAVTRAIALPTAVAASESFIQARVAEIEIRPAGQSVS